MNRTRMTLKQSIRSFATVWPQYMFTRSSIIFTLQNSWQKKRLQSQVLFAQNVLTWKLASTMYNHIKRIKNPGLWLAYIYTVFSSNVSVLVIWVDYNWKIFWTDNQCTKNEQNTSSNCDVGTNILVFYHFSIYFNNY